MNDAVIGKEVDGYRIQSVLGRGGMGTVYKAKDINLSRTVAIKRINPSQSDREAFIHRFRSEAQALARIDSPHIVGVYALRETDIGLLIVMEYVEGGTLKEPLDREGAMSPKQAIPILEQNLRAFYDAHSAGVIHRDIKPQNIMLTKDGMVKVTDFGIAKLRQPDSGETVTQGGQGGTLKYMSPEQISSIDDVDQRSDLYSLGMTAYEMLAGTLPFTETDTDFDIMRKVVEGEIPPPDEYNPDIPSGLAQWVVGAIHTDQDDRYQSAREMLEALEDANQQMDVTVTQPDWEVDDGSADVEETQTFASDGGGRTQTAVPGGEQGDEAPVDPTGETMMDPDAAVADRPETPAGDASEEEPPGDGSTGGGVGWGVLTGGVIGLLVALVGGYVAFTMMTGGSGTLSVTTAPSGAEVAVEGEVVGTTPLEGYAVEPGAIGLQVTKSGFLSVDTTLQIGEGEHLSLQNVSLAKASREESTSPVTADAGSDDQSGRQPSRRTEPSDPAATDESTPEVSSASADEPASSPSGTEEATADNDGSEVATGLVEVTPKPDGVVRIDGEKQSAGSAIPLTTGRHTITCEHQSFGSVEKTVSVSEGETETVSCYFQQQVTVTTDGPFGRIWLNHSDTGKSTPTTLSLPPGTHRIALRRKTLDNFQVLEGTLRTKRGDSGDARSLSGSSCEITVEPTFTEVVHALSFQTAGG